MKNSSVSHTPVVKNTIHPLNTPAATAYSLQEYRFPPQVPISSTGTIFAHLPKVCVGNVTYFKLSYWQNVEVKLHNATRAYEYSGAMGRGLDFVYRSMVAATATATRRLMRTRKAVSVKREPSGG